MEVGRFYFDYRGIQWGRDFDLHLHLLLSLHCLGVFRSKAGLPCGDLELSLFSLFVSDLG